MKDTKVENLKTTVFVSLASRVIPKEHHVPEISTSTHKGNLWEHSNPRALPDVKHLQENRKFPSYLAGIIGIKNNEVGFFLEDEIPIPFGREKIPPDIH
jgi:hypothetical protein